MIKLDNITKEYDGKLLFRNLNYTFEKGKIYGIHGTSGSGKTTLLNIIAGFEKADSGKVIYQNTYKTRDKFFLNEVSFVFQNFLLIEDETVYQNLAISISREKNKRNIIKEALMQYQLESLIDTKIYKLSGGEQQRVAIIRATLKKFNVLLADEPTGSLDGINAEIILQKLKEVAKDKVVIVVTHDHEVLMQMDNIINIKNYQ